MSDAASWPDPSRPGVPLNPERDGWHWLIFSNGERVCCWWHSAANGWNSSDDPSGACDYYLPEQAAQDHVGCEPCLLPSEVAAREAAAAIAMQVAAAAAYAARLWRMDEDAIPEAIRALPLPAPDALARALADAERRGMERAAALIEAQEEAFRTRSGTFALQPRTPSNVAGLSFAAAIRAAAQGETRDA
jgi:hypothetical protein